jgi:cytochrome b561
MSEVATIWPLSIRLTHWLNAALVVGALALGAIMVFFVHDAATRFDLTETHKSIV